MSQNFSGMRNIILFLLIAVPLLALIYNFSQPDNIANEKIRIGIDQYPGFEYLFVAEKEGFFKEAGLQIELVELSSLTEVRRAFERNKIDGMTSTLVEVLEAYKYSDRIAQIALVIDFSNGADVILASPKIKSVQDLRNKKIGIESGSLSSYLLYRSLELNNLKPTDITLMPMEKHEMFSALKTGKVDAITSYPPHSVTIQKLLQVNQIFDSSEIPGEIMEILAIDKKVLSKRPDLQGKLHRVWGKTREYIETNPDKAYATLVERFPISIEEFKQAMEKIQLVGSEDQNKYLTLGGIAQTTLEKIGNNVFLHSEKKPSDYSQFIYNNR